MTRQDEANLVAAFRGHFPTTPAQNVLREWMREVRWVLDLSPRGMNKAYRAINAEVRRRTLSGPKYNSPHADNMLALPKDQSQPERRHQQVVRILQGCDT